MHVEGTIYVGGSVWLDMGRVNRQRRGISGYRLYVYFYGEENEGINDMLVRIIDKTNVSEPTDRFPLRSLSISFKTGLI